MKNWMVRQDAFIIDPEQEKQVIYVRDRSQRTV